MVLAPVDRCLDILNDVGTCCTIGVWTCLPVLGHVDRCWDLLNCVGTC